MLDYYSVLNLRCKEITHRESSGRGYSRRNTHGWTLSHSVGTRDYRWHKRRIAKQDRRNARLVINEYDDFDTNLYDWLLLVTVIAENAVRWGGMLEWFREENLVSASRGCHCATCVQLRFRPR